MGTGIMILIIGLVLYPLSFFGIAFLSKYDKDIEDLCPLIKKRNCSRQIEKDVIFFSSRRSAGIIVLMWFPVFAMLIQAIFEWHLDILIVSLIISLTIIWLDYSTGYTITPTHIRVNCLMFRSEVNLEALVKVSRSNNPISAPALSVKRLEITTTDGGMILISPVEEELFLKVLKERSSNLTIT